MHAATLKIKSNTTTIEDGRHTWECRIIKGSLAEKLLIYEQDPIVSYLLSRIEKSRVEKSRVE